MEMKFFEFNHSTHYALIGSPSRDEAVDFYQEVVADVEDSDGWPDEITEGEAREKLAETSENDYLKFKEFESDIDIGEPFLILVDDSLT